MGDAHRIPKSTDKKYSDPCFEQLLRVDPKFLPRNNNPFFTRPAYAYTKAAVGGINHDIFNI